jgi:membrane protease YdiL (CAAX protease family)
MSSPLNPARDAGEPIGRDTDPAVTGPGGSVPADRSTDDGRYSNDRIDADQPVGPAPADGPDTTTTPEPRPGHRELLVGQKERFGGMKLGTAFFGWLAATGLTVILVAALAAVGVGVGAVGQDLSAGTEQTQTVGLVGAIVLLVILFLAYLAGGYVAGRMARFSGARQGLAVWLWGVVMAALIAGVAAIVGSRYDILGSLNLPRVQIGEQTDTLATVIGIAVAAAVALVGAILGGLAGMRFHRRVDRTDVLDRSAG